MAEQEEQKDSFERFDNPQSGAENDIESENELSDIFDFSPFDEDVSQGEEASGSTGTEREETQESQPEQGEQSQQQQTGESREAQLEKELAELRGQLQQLQQSQQTQQQQGQEQQAGQEGQGQSLPSYDFNIPDELIKQMDAADDTTRKQALGNFAKGVAQAVDQQLRSEFGQQLQQMRQEMPQQAQQTVTQTAEAQQVKQDFFGNYPHLDRPELKPLIQSTAQKVLQETGAQQWNQELRDKIAGRVNEVLRGAGAAPNGASTQSGNGQKPPRQFDGGSRPNTESKGENSQDEIARTLFG